MLEKISFINCIKKISTLYRDTFTVSWILNIFPEFPKFALLMYINFKNLKFFPSSFFVIFRDAQNVLPRLVVLHTDNNRKSNFIESPRQCLIR